MTPAPLAVPLLPPAVLNAPIGAVAEICPASDTIVAAVANRLQMQGGAALIIDYGHVRSATGDTLQAMKNHNFVDPLAEPGHADITAHVDFENLCKKAIGATAHGPVEQGDFLMGLGINARAEQLKRRATPHQARDIDAALARLTDRTAMGRLFKVLALTGPGPHSPAGFALKTDRQEI